jgi:Frag1/DRAM/Sfk1 family
MTSKSTPLSPNAKKYPQTSTRVMARSDGGTLLPPWPLLVFMFVVMIILLPATYTMSKEQGTLSTTIPFISASIDFAPASCVGTLGLSLICLAMLPAVLVKWRCLQSTVTKVREEHGGSGNLVENGVWERWNNIILGVSVLSVVALQGVASFQYHNVPPVHLTFAAVFFLASMFFLVGTAVLEWKVGAAEGHRRLPKSVRNFRVATAAIDLLAIVPFFLFQFLGQSTGQRNVDLSISAAAEILATLMIFVFVLSYWHEFRRVKLAFAVLDASEAQNFSVQGSRAPLLARN